MTSTHWAAVQLPPRMSVDLALGLSEVLTGLGQQTLPAQLLAMLLVHTSWVTGGRGRTVAEHAEIIDMIGDTDMSELLPLLTLPELYGHKDSMEGAECFLNMRRLRHSLESTVVAVGATYEVVRSCLQELQGRLAQYDSYLLAEELQAVLSLYAASEQESPDRNRRGMALNVSSPAHRRHLEASQHLLGEPHLLYRSEAGDRVKPSSIWHGQPVWTIGDMQLQNVLAEGEGRPAPKQEPAQRNDEPAHATQVFDPREAKVALERVPSLRMPGDGNARQVQLLETMACETGRRAQTQIPEGDPLAELREGFPHFADVLDFIESALALAACGQEGRAVTLPPILLRGEPGTGKTYFAQELARVLGTHFIERDLSVTSEAFVLSGMDSTWKGSKPGVIFEALIHGKTANPLICLNEVDKAYTTGSHNSPLAPMYALLEPTSSSRFRDEFVPVDVDASRVVWVLTANDGPIPDPILSRLEVFQIPTPSAEQCKAIAQSVWASLCRKMFPVGHGFEPQLDSEQLAFVSRMSPRVMRKALTHAASLAARAKKNRLGDAELTAAAARYCGPARQAMGFVH